jgi:hypothetical protein
MNSFNSQAGKLSASLPISFNSPHDANQLCSHQLTALNDGFESPSLRHYFGYTSKDSTTYTSKSCKMSNIVAVRIVPHLFILSSLYRPITLYCRTMAIVSYHVDLPLKGQACRLP